jgi:lysophospholipase L1-like esterase
MVVFIPNMLPQLLPLTVRILNSAIVSSFRAIFSKRCKKLRIAQRVCFGFYLFSYFLFSAEAPKNPLQERIEIFQKEDASQFPKAAGNFFIGSSSIVKWTHMEEKFAPAPIIQRGFGGTGIQQILDLTDQFVIPYKPKRVILYAGDNDLSFKNAVEIFNGYKEFVKKVQDALPDTSIIYLGIKPSPQRANLMEKAREVNSSIKQFIANKPKLLCVDSWDMFLDAQGKPREELYADGLHLNEAGYKIWEEALKPVLKE